MSEGDPGLSLAERLVAAARSGLESVPPQGDRPAAFAAALAAVSDGAIDPPAIRGCGADELRDGIDLAAKDLLLDALARKVVSHEVSDATPSELEEAGTDLYLRLIVVTDRYRFGLGDYAEPEPKKLFPIEASFSKWARCWARNLGGRINQERKRRARGTIEEPGGSSGAVDPGVHRGPWGAFEEVAEALGRDTARRGDLLAVPDATWRVLQEAALAAWNAEVQIAEGLRIRGVGVERVVSGAIREVRSGGSAGAMDTFVKRHRGQVVDLVVAAIDEVVSRRQVASWQGAGPLPRPFWLSVLRWKSVHLEAVARLVVNGFVDEVADARLAARAEAAADAMVWFINAPSLDIDEFRAVVRSSADRARLRLAKPGSVRPSAVRQAHDILLDPRSMHTDAKRQLARAAITFFGWLTDFVDGAPS